MRLNIGEILEGWRNHLIPPEKLKELIEETSEYRLSICNVCEFNSEVKRANNEKFSSSWRIDAHCTVCSCPLVQKSKALHANCPLNPPKWDRVASDSESIEISNGINGNPV